MKYVASTIKYVFAHFLPLMLLAALPAIDIVVLFEPNGFGLLAPWSFPEGVKFLDVFFLVFNRETVTVYPYLFPVVLLILTACVSYSLGVVDKHFRVGKFTLRSPFAVINDCFLPTGIMILLLAAIYLVAKFLIVCVFSLLSFIMGRIGLPIVAIGFVLTVIGVVAVIGVILISVPLMYTSATMLVYGYSFTEAFGVALKLGSKEKKKAVDFGIVGAFMIYTILIAAIDALPVTAAASIPISFVLTAFLIQYSCVFVMVSFFDLSGIERRDVKNNRYGG